MSKLKNVPLAGERLLAEYPALEKVRPLRVGVRQDLITAGWSEEDAAAALSWYCGRTEYLEACAHAGKRYSLSGQPVGLMDPLNARNAIIQLHNRKMQACRPPEVRWE